MGSFASVDILKVNNVENEAVSWIRLSDYRILTNGLITFTTDKVPSSENCRFSLV